MKEAIIKTVLHIVELAASLGAAWVIMQIFDLDSASIGVVIAVAINALSAFSRKSSLLKKDWVNER